MSEKHPDASKPGEGPGGKRGLDDVAPIESTPPEEDLEPARDGLLEPEDGRREA